MFKRTLFFPPTKPACSVAFPTLIDNNYTFRSRKPKPWRQPCLVSPLHTTWGYLAALPPQYTQNPTTSHCLHCCHPGVRHIISCLGCSDLLIGTLASPLVPYGLFLTEQPNGSFQHVRQVVSFLCKTLQWFSSLLRVKAKILVMILKASLM